MDSDGDLKKKVKVYQWKYEFLRLPFAPIPNTADISGRHFLVLRILVSADIWTHEANIKNGFEAVYFITCRQLWHEPRRRGVGLIFVHFYVLFCNGYEAFNNICYDSMSFLKCKWKCIGYRLNIGYRHYIGIGYQRPCSLSISASAISAKTHIGQPLPETPRSPAPHNHSDSFLLFIHKKVTT